MAQIVSLVVSAVTTVGLTLVAYQLTAARPRLSVIGNALMLWVLAFLSFRNRQRDCRPRQPQVNIDFSRPRHLGTRAPDHAITL